MNQRIHGRPSGTDGSDFSFRMVVDSRYTKVAKAKSQLRTTLLIQAFIQISELLLLILPFSRIASIDHRLLWTVVSGFIVLFIGLNGRQRSRGSMLLMYAVCSSSLTLFRVTVLQREKMKLLEAGLLLMKFFVQIYAIITVVLLVRNMTPPKKTS